jgi:osmotically-inducible protein OsmY
MVDDKTLKQAVLDELQWEPSVNAAHIGVTAKDGVVTLSGHVETYTEKSAAEKATRRVSDVKAVAEEIEVKLPFGNKHDDADIAAAAVERLKWESSIPTGVVKVKVEKGWVTLTGQIDWHYQAEAAVSAIRSLWGVVGVSNLVTVKARPNTSAIRENILKALNRSWFDPATIGVTAQGGEVKLTGTVKSWYERDEANSAAWAAPGTTSVDNAIRVN